MAVTSVNRNQYNQYRGVRNGQQNSRIQHMLRTTFAPPLWGGGSPITSYSGRMGLRKRNLNSNEIQTAMLQLSLNSYKMGASLQFSRQMNTSANAASLYRFDENSKLYTSLSRRFKQYPLMVGTTTSIRLPLQTEIWRCCDWRFICLLCSAWLVEGKAKKI
eukprot:scaffold126185_cov42-Cyclotella_meneghiniana.AAC.2